MFIELLLKIFKYINQNETLCICEILLYKNPEIFF